MRFILEHPWIASLSMTAVAFALSWTGLRDDNSRRCKIGVVVFLFAVAVCITGVVIDTPTEHAKRVIYSFINAVENEDIPAALATLHQDVVLVDTWKEISEEGIEGVAASISYLNAHHSLSYNTVLRFQPVERDGDVFVELSLLSRVSGIGTVPSRWRILVMPNEQGSWRIYSIDAVEIMGRSFR